MQVTVGNDRNNELTDAKKFADVVDNLAWCSNVVLIAYDHYLFHRKYSQPVGQERIVHANAQSNLQTGNIKQFLLESTVNSCGTEEDVTGYTNQLLSARAVKYLHIILYYVRRTTVTWC